MADDETANGGTVDASQHYPDDLELDNGPYYNQTDRSPSLSNLVEDLGLQAETDFPTPPNAYAADVESEVATPTKAKRAPTKRAKASKKPVEDSEQESTDHEGEREAENEGDYEDDGDDDFELENVVPAKKTRTPKSAGKRKSTSTKTPKSKGKAPAKTPKSQKSTGKTKEALPPNRQRRAPKNGINDARPIPRCYEECDAIDKALIDMRDKEHKTWRVIRAAIEDMTGQRTGNSTLPNRYERLKDNFSIIREEDRSRLLEAKDEVEKEMTEKKWMLIAEKVKQSGGDEYSADHLQRQYKKLMLKEGLRPPPGIVDPDFDIAVSDDEDDD